MMGEPLAPVGVATPTRSRDNASSMSFAPSGPCQPTPNKLAWTILIRVHYRKPHPAIALHSGVYSPWKL